MREAALRRIAAMDEGKRTAFKEKCAANGRKSWAMRSAADKAEQIARINAPEVRKRASDANKAKYQAMTDEERAPLVANPCGATLRVGGYALSARHKARWLHPTEARRSPVRGIPFTRPLPVAAKRRTGMSGDTATNSPHDYSPHLQRGG